MTVAIKLRYHTTAMPQNIIFCWVHVAPDLLHKNGKKWMYLTTLTKIWLFCIYLAKNIYKQWLRLTIENTFIRISVGALNGMIQIFVWLNKVSSDKLHFAVSHWLLYPIHLLPIHLVPSNIGHALWCVCISGSSFRKRLYQMIPSPLSGKTEIPANGQTVAPPKWQRGICWHGIKSIQSYVI